MNIFTHYTDINHIINDKEFNEELDSLIEEYDKLDLFCPTVGKGKVVTTCSDSTAVLMLSKQNLIVEWLQKSLEEYFKYNNVENFYYRIRRQWCNCSYHGSEIKPHNHVATDGSLVAVLYYKIPKNCSKYVLIDSNDAKETYKDYPSELLSFIDVTSGLSIIHNPNYYHAVTEQLSTERRIVFVFDIEYRLQNDTTR